MKSISLAMLYSDWLIYLLLLLSIMVGFYMRRFPHLRDPWRQVMRNKIGMIAFTILCFYILVGLLDSIHLHIQSFDQQTKITKTASVLDLILAPLDSQDEKTYSAPFSRHLYNREGTIFPQLKYTEKKDDISLHIAKGLIEGVLFLLLLLSPIIFYLKIKNKNISYPALITASIIWLIIFILGNLMHAYHIFGTNKIGQDVFYHTLKSIRTGLLIGTLTTIFIIPMALFLGMFSGYFRGWVDDLIQYLYTTLSSIPGVLLISASVLILQVYIANHPHLFPTLAQRADARLLALCFILGITSWSDLCRLLRGETLKIRELDFVRASRALGASHFKILLRHITPNLIPIILITIVLDFSGLVLAEAVLSYVGVGVDPTTISWGNMINSSRLELAREPIVWWPLAAAMIFMFILVLSANLFSDAVRDAFDPRLHLDVK